MEKANINLVGLQPEFMGILSWFFSRHTEPESEPPQEVVEEKARSAEVLQDIFGSQPEEVKPKKEEPKDALFYLIWDGDTVVLANPKGVMWARNSTSPMDVNEIERSVKYFNTTHCGEGATFPKFPRAVTISKIVIVDHDLSPQADILRERLNVDAGVSLGGKYSISKGLAAYASGESYLPISLMPKRELGTVALLKSFFSR